MSICTYSSKSVGLSKQAKLDRNDTHTIEPGSKKSFGAALVATALDHYDVALYGFMAPVLVQVFLPMYDTVHGLIMAYCITPLGMISRPLGALVIGRMGDRFGRKKALSVSIWGMAIATTLVGFLPTYAKIGYWAPVLFAFLKLVQDFFLAGGYNGGAIFTLEHVSASKRGFWSGLYISATVIGILLASFAATIVSYLPQGYWRWPYILAFFTGLVAMYIRKSTKESPEFLKNKEKRKHTSWKYIRNHLGIGFKKILCAVMVTFCYSTVTKMVQVFMNVFVLQVTSLSMPVVMTVHTLGLLLFLLILPLFGKLGDRLGLGRSMFWGAVATAVLSVPLFKMLELDSLYAMIGMKVIFVVLSAWFVAPFHGWMQSLFQVHERYTFISFSYAVGARIGSCMIPLALYLWNSTQILYIPCAVLVLGAILGAWGVRAMDRSRE